MEESLNSKTWRSLSTQNIQPEPIRIIRLVKQPIPIEEFKIKRERAEVYCRICENVVVVLIVVGVCDSKTTGAVNLKLISTNFCKEY